MGHFKDEEDVYRFIGRMFQELAADPELAPRLQKANTTVRFDMREPESQITVEMRPDQEIQVDFGPSELDPEVTMSLAADTAHRFWLGNVNVTVAMARGQIIAKGPVAKVLKLVRIVKPVFPRYHQMLEDAGRADLLEAA